LGGDSEEKGLTRGSQPARGFRKQTEEEFCIFGSSEDKAAAIATVSLARTISVGMKQV